jgi:hypothetical protein
MITTTDAIAGLVTAALLVGAIAAVVAQESERAAVPREPQVQSEKQPPVVELQSGPTAAQPPSLGVAPDETPPAEQLQTDSKLLELQLLLEKQQDRASRIEQKIDAIEKDRRDGGR